VPGTADYTALGKPRIVKFAVTCGRLGGRSSGPTRAPGRRSCGRTPRATDFQVELVLADKPVDMGIRSPPAKVHIGWATVDMLAAGVNREPADPRTMPRVFSRSTVQRPAMASCPREPRSGDRRSARQDVGSPRTRRRTTSSQHAAQRWRPAAEVHMSSQGRVPGRGRVQPGQEVRPRSSRGPPDIYN